MQANSVLPSACHPRKFLPLNPSFCIATQQPRTERTICNNHECLHSLFKTRRVPTDRKNDFVQCDSLYRNDMLRTGAPITVVFCPSAERGQTAHGVCLLLFLRHLLTRRSLKQSVSRMISVFQCENLVLPLNILHDLAHHPDEPGTPNGVGADFSPVGNQTWRKQNTTLSTSR